MAVHRVRWTRRTLWIAQRHGCSRS